MTGPRHYQMRARAVAAAETGRRIVGAMQALFEEQPYDQISLAMVATRAGVTLQTVLRRFGSKARLFAAAAADARARIAAQRGEAPADDAPAAIRNLFDHYEAWGRLSLRLSQQEDRLPEIAALTRAAREVHVAWVDRVFAAALRGRRGTAREVTRGQLVALTDVHVWKILRHERKLSREAAERAVLELVERSCAPRQDARAPAGEPRR